MQFSSRFAGVFGVLDLHGETREISWTHLEGTVTGGRTITVVDETDWSDGDEIVLTTTSYDPWHTETFTITGVTNNGKTFTLDKDIQHKHLGK